MYSTAIYRNSPAWAQEWLITLRRGGQKFLREDANFRKLVIEAEARQYWKRDQIDEWMKARLSLLLERAEKVVPYYRECHLAGNNQGCSSLSSLARYPILRKHDVARSLRAFIAQDMGRTRRFKGSTSGTNGSPLTIYQSLESIRRENAFVRRQMHWAGYKDGDRRVWIRGDMIVPSDHRRAPYWRFSRPENMLMMSSYHLSEESAREYIDALRRFDAVLIHAYPSSIAYLANWLWHRGQNANLKSLRGIMTSSETLCEQQRERIEAAFGVQVFDWYGSFERVAAIGTCEHGRHHVIDDYGHVEFIPVMDDLFEIVGTGFNNDMMPLIRYSTGDMVELEDREARCECGRSFRLVKRIVGRMDDVIKTKDGRVIGRMDHIYKGLNGILEAQIVQNRIDAIEVHVVPADDEALPEKTVLRLKESARRLIGDDMKVGIVTVARLPRTRNGKVRAVVCNI